MKTYFTSDLHFHHRGICKFTDRKDFTTQEQHDDWLANIWNSQVRNQDKIWHLGDFSFSHDKEEVLAFVKQLKGQKFFIKGNHDRSEMLDYLKENNAIQNWFDYKEIKIAGIHTCLFHFPVASWCRQHYGAWHLHGHSHGEFQGQGKILDVGIDSAYKLLGEHRFFTEQDIEQIMKSKEIQIDDNHRKDKSIE